MGHSLRFLLNLRRLRSELCKFTLTRNRCTASYAHLHQCNIDIHQSNSSSKTIQVNLVQSASIYVFLCVAKMVEEMYKRRRTSKEIPIHNATHKDGPAAEGGRPTSVGAARPHYGWVFLYLYSVFAHLVHHLGSLLAGTHIN
jgi:hypothetical protein